MAGVDRLALLQSASADRRLLQDQEQEDKLHLMDHMQLRLLSRDAGAELMGTHSDRVNGQSAKMQQIRT